MEIIQDSSHTKTEQNLSAPTEFHQFIHSVYQKQYEDVHRYGGKVVAAEFVSELFEIIFAGYFSEKTFKDISQVEDALALFFLNTKRRISPYLQMREGKKLEGALDIDGVIFELKQKLPQVYEQIWEDANAAYEGDPAAESVKEVVLAYSGFYAIAVHRIAHILYNLSIPIFPRMISGFAHEKTGIDIHPGAKIGRSFFMDHGTGIVIGGTTEIANNVKIYQGVTLGAISVSKELANVKRHPTIEDNVIIYSGATILGGKTVIGKNSVIGGNAWVTGSVPPFSIVYQTNEMKVRNSQDIPPSTVDFVI
jgi:serine O-acetyltransferase